MLPGGSQHRLQVGDWPEVRELVGIPDRSEASYLAFDDLEFEVHTATFPLAQGLEIANESFIPSCDPDGDSGLQPDGPPEVEGPPFCTDPSQLELDLDIRMMDHGDGVLRSASDFENSGVRGDFLSRASWDLKFRSKSPDKGFQYVCMIHPFMRGKVIVK